MYSLPDHKVVCHSHVAYGAPNKWHRYKNRGRKRCGMLFAMPSVRRQLDLKTRPAYDPDTRAGRLKQADPYLQKVLYGSVDTMVAAYGAPKPVSPAPKLAPRIAAPKSDRKQAPTPSRPSAKAVVKKKASERASRVHVVRPGETLMVISGKTGVSMSKIRALNGLRSDRILVGQKLKLE